MFSNFVPEVKNISEGTRNVENVDFASLEEVNNFLKDYEFINSGMEALIFKSKIEPEIVVRVELYNPLGREWTIDFLSKLLENGTDSDLKIRDALKILSTASEGIYDLLVQSSEKSVMQRVAAHNAQFRRDPSSTVPINLVFTLNSRPFAVRMKFLDGISAKDDDEILSKQIKLTSDGNPDNTLVNIKNSPHKKQLIDLRKFKPSNRR